MFDKALEIVTGMEGDYSNHKSDPGGKTKFGITEEVARDWGYYGDMRDLDKKTQRQIAKDLYWQPIGGDILADIAPNVSVEMFEIGFNVGTGRGTRWLQRWLNAFSRNGRDYSRTTVDGIWGPNTRDTLKAYLSVRSEENLVRGLNGKQIQYYLSLVEQDPETYGPFLNGWMNKRSTPYLGGNHT